MSLRKNITKCITQNKSPDETARLVLGYLYDIDLLEPGNGWLDNDPEMQDGGLNKAWKEWNEVKKLN